MSKSRDAFRTISEVSDVLDTPAHVLRFWESKFTQVKPVKRAGGRRYYRPADVDLLAGIKKLLHVDGMTIKGAQKLMREQGVKHVTAIGADIMGSAQTNVDSTGDIETQATAAGSTSAPEPENTVHSSPAAPEKPESQPEPEDAAPDVAQPEVAITNVVPLQPASDGPALSVNIAAAPDTPPSPAEDAAETAPPKVTPPDVPADPSDSDSKAPARLFHLLRTAPPDALEARAQDIAPLLARMRTLRGRISLR